MITLTITGVLTVFCGLTLPLLLLVIFQKEPKETADTIDRVLLGIALLGLAATMLYTGGLVMAGTFVGLATQKLTVAIVVNNMLKATFLTAAWAKILRNLAQNRKRSVK